MNNPDDPKSVMQKVGYVGLAFVIALLAFIYYLYTRPYEINTATLTVTADFPGTPTSQIMSLAMTKDYSTPMQEYRFEQSGNVYIVSITKVDSFYLQQFGYQKVMSRYFNAITKLGGYYGFAKDVKLGHLVGQSISTQSNHGVMKGKFFLTSGGFVAIMVQVPDQVMTQAGLWFIDSLTIKEHSASLG